MADAKMLIPVFLPGNDRKWEEIQGLATITDDGEINIKLQHKEAAYALVRMREQDVIFALGFDYFPEQMKPKESK